MFTVKVQMHRDNRERKVVLHRKLKYCPWF